MWTARQANLLRRCIGERDAMVEVRWAMRYGEPAIAAELDKLCAEGATRILVFPAYPQYSSATTTSVLDDVADWIRRTRRLPELRFVHHYHDDSTYIDWVPGCVCCLLWRRSAIEAAVAYMESEVDWAISAQAELSQRSDASARAVPVSFIDTFKPRLPAPQAVSVVSGVRRVGKALKFLLGAAMIAALIAWGYASRKG